MDKATPALLTIAAFKGLNTNAARGTHDQPTKLENAYFDHAGGYAPQYARSLRLSGVVWAWSSGVGSNVFYTAPDNSMNHFDTFFLLINVIAGVTNTGTAVNIMPNLLMTTAGAAAPVITSMGPLGRPTTTYVNQYVYPDGVQSGGGAGTVTVTYDTAGAAETGFTGSAGTFEYFVVYNTPDPRTANRYPQARYFYFTNSGALTTNFIPVLDFSPLVTVGGAVYYRVAGTTGAWQIGLASNGGSGFSGARVQRVSLGLDVNSTAYFAFATTPTMPREYHKGRAYIAPASYQYFDPGTFSVGITQDAKPNRVWYSNVIASASLKASPTWGLLGFFDMPFRVSRRVVSLLSVANYLYIFGDRELFLLTGDPAEGGRLESIGDSIGVVAPGSVQQLGGVGYWLSDSGVMSVRGGQVQEISTDVRDLISAMIPANVTSTVDFGRELYLLTDGITTLVYNAREQAWATRTQASTGTLVYGGGTAYALALSSLYSVGGEKDNTGASPASLDLTAEWGPLECGTWNGRKRFDTLCIGLDLASVNGTLIQQSDVMERGVVIACTAQAVTVLPGSGYSVTHVSADGVKATGQSIRPRFLLSSQDKRAILRPPLVITGAVTAEIGVD